MAAVPERFSTWLPVAVPQEQHELRVAEDGLRPSPLTGVTLP